METGNFIFYFISGITVAAALMALTVRNLFHCALFLAMTMFGISGIFLYLNADFLAAVQVLIYVGAVTVLIIFGISLTRNVMATNTRPFNKQVLLSVLAAALLGGIIIAALQESPFLTSQHPVSIMLTMPAADSTAPNGTPNSNPYFQDGPALLAAALLKPDGGFAFAFEFVSVLLLGALVGAIVIARKDPS